MEELTQSPTQPSPDPDLVLVEASTRGDTTSFEELVRRYDRKLLRIAQQVTHDSEDAQDAVQETFLKAYQKLNQFRGTSKFSTWLIRIALNESLMKLRTRRYTQELPLEYEDPNGENVPLDVTDWSPDPEQIYSRAELHGILRKVLQELAPILRVVFVLRDVEGLSIKETTAILDLQSSTVKARLHRARLQLREKLSKYFRKPLAPGAKLNPAHRGPQRAMTSMSVARSSEIHRPDSVG
jgi:RNA polymerase sigma-70 factor (ECF subfamily)